MGFFKKGLRKIFTRGAKKPNDYKTDSKDELATDKEGHHNKITLFHGRSRREKFLHCATTGITSRYAFLLVLVAYFPQIGFYEFSAKLDSARQKGFSDLELLLTLLFMPFLGCTWLEHIGTLPLLDFQPLIAKTAVPSADCMRDYLKQLASLPELDRKIDPLYQGWVQRGLIDGRAIYLDGHVIEYFGEKPLEKTKHGVKNKLVKALLRYCPYDMVTNIPLGNIFVPASTKLSVKILQFIGRTEKTTGRHIELVIFDRGGNNLEVFKKLQQRNTHYSAWAKDNYVAIKNLKNQVNKAFISIDEAVTAALHRR